MRERDPSADLRRGYRVRLERCVFVALVAHIVLFSVWRGVRVTAYQSPKREVVIRIEDIPETRQEVKRPPPPPRPSVPVEVRGEEVSEEATIESTELDVHEDVPAPPPPPPPVEEEEAPPGPEDEIMEFWHVEVKPRLLKSVVPEYPEIARKAGIAGTVFVKILVGKDGRPEEVEFIKGPRIFREVALEAAWEFVFSPAKQNDRPVRVWVIVPIRFRLRD
ncbi:MAG TPA: energy transducer TonB [Candidatus Latescibacteria bacterium]|nr:energy transducer TonB [Candidatus Latescibacterota bacterium]